MTSVFYVVALVLVFVIYDERLVHHVDQQGKPARVSFKSVLAFENFVAADGRGLQRCSSSIAASDRSCRSTSAQLGTPVDRVPLVAGILFSISAACGALGNQLCGWLLERMPARRVIATSAATRRRRGAGLRHRAAAPDWLFAATPLFGLAMGTATTTAYTAASSVMPASARGAGFGLLTTASLTALALSPIINGLLAATSIRAVFLLDLFGLLTLVVVVSRLMVIAPLERPTTPAVEEG